MSRETPAEAIRRHLGRGMDPAVLERIYGPGLVQQIVGMMPKPAAKLTFPKRLARAREAAAWTITDLARELRLRADHVLAYETGDRRPASPDIIERLAKFLKEPADQLRAEFWEDA